MRIIEAVVHQIEIKKNSKYERQTDNISIDNKIVKSPIKTNLPIILMHFLYMPLHIHILYWQRWTIKKKITKSIVKSSTFVQICFEDLYVVVPM